MNYMADSNGYHPVFKKLSKKVQYFKESQKGVNEMGNVFEEYHNERMNEELLATAEKMLHEGLSLETIARILPSLSTETLSQLQKAISA